MTALLFTLTAVGVVAAVLARWLWRRRRALLRSRRAGYAPGNAIAVRRYDEIDAAVARERCHCGGRLRVTSEGGTTTVRVVHSACERCEQHVDLFFDLSQIQH